MAKQISLQDVLSVVGAPLREKSLWALLLRGAVFLERTIQEANHLDNEEPTLLITPESILLSHGGSVQILPGIPGETSIFSPQEMQNTAKAIDTEKFYINALGRSLLYAMRYEQQQLPPDTSGKLQHLFSNMVKEECDLRPSLQQVIAACNSHFQNDATQASDEVDRMVSYVLGSAFEQYSDSEQLDVDLEAEIEQVMNRARASSTDHLYPPSHGSSVLSMGNQSLSSSAARAHPDSPDMYSSLPTVFRSASHSNRPASNSVSSSAEKFDPLTDRSSQQRPHYCTPSRRKKHHIQGEKTPLLDQVLFRSSSDGKKKVFVNSPSLMNTHAMQLDDMPPLVRSLDAAITFDDSNSEASFTAISSEKPVTPIDSDKASTKQESSFEYSEPVSPPLSSALDDTEDFNFPSPPPLPSAADWQSGTPTSVESVELNTMQQVSNEEQDAIEQDVIQKEEPKDQDVIQVGEPEEQDVVQEKEPDVGVGDPKEQDAIEGGEDERTTTRISASEEDQQDENSNEEQKLQDTLKIDVVQEELVCENSVVSEVYRGSVGKLNQMFGPEFHALSGYHVGDKKPAAAAAVKMPYDRRAVNVILLSGHVIQFIVEVTSTCRELFNQVVAHQSLEETHIFGLAVISEHGELFMELDHKLMKYAQKGWVNSSKGISVRNFTVIFRVKYYVENVNQLCLDSTRHLYYLQLRKDILEGKTYCHEQSALKLAAYSLQSERGDKIPASQELRVEDYLHSKVINKLGRATVQSILSNMHSELHGLSKGAAEIQYLMEAQTLPEYGMVFYQVAKTKHGKIGSIWLGLSVRGIVIFDVHKGIKTPNSHWSWKKIKNLSYANNRFIMELEDNKSQSYYTESYKKAQYLLHLSINYHRFQLLPRVESKNIFKPEGRSYTVEMVKNDNIIGLRLAGGKNKVIGGGHIFVQSINKGSVADLQGKIQEHDILVEVNGESVWGLTHREAAEKILSTTSVTLNLHRPYSQQWLEN